MSSRGVFLLSDILDQQLEGTGVSQSEVFIQTAPVTSPNTGYYSGGQPNPAKTDTEKTNFSTDTTSVTPSTNLTIPRIIFSAVGSQTTGYFGGGMNATSTLQSAVDKLTYADDTMYLAPGAIFNDARSGFGAVGNVNSGYFGGGRDTSTPAVGSSRTDKTTYSNDTNSLLPGAELSAARNYILSGTGNSTHGYIGGGYPSPYSTMDQITYSTETTSQIPGASLSEARFSLAATGNADAGYFGGGWPLPGPKVSIMDKLTYSSNTTAALPSTGDLSYDEVFENQASGNSTHGYFGGGFASVTPGDAVTSMDRLEYSTDTTSALPGADLVSARAYHAATGPRENVFSSTVTFPVTQFKTGVVSGPNTGYFAGGTPGNYSYIQKSDFSSETTSTIPATISIGRSYIAQVSTTQNGYFAGGIAGSTKYSRTEKLTYSTDTSSALPSSGDLSASIYGCAGASSLNNGYIAGGATPSPVSTMVKIQFADDTTASAPVITEQKAYMQSLSDLTNVYQIGGWSGSTSHSSVDRVVTSSDTVTRIPTADLTHAIHGCYGIGYSDVGYLRGGYEAASITYTQKVTYSTETSSVVPGAPMEWNSHYHTAAGNNTDGYTTGGGTTTSVSKLNYSTETSSVAQNIEHGKGGMGGTGARNFGRTQAAVPTPTSQTVNKNLDTGYLAQGTYDVPPAAAVTHIQKVDLSTESYSLIPGQTSNALNASVGASSPTDGYVTGGQSPLHTITDKIVYSSDTASRAPNADLSAGRNYFSAMSSGTSGYFMGGFAPPGAQSTTDKLVYSSDTMAVETSANLTLGGQYAHTCLGNLDAGYACGGVASSPTLAYTTQCQKLTYADDTNATAPGTNMTPPAYGRTSGGNSTTHGYVSGGNPSALTRTDKLSFSTETVARQPSADVPVATAYNASVGNTNFGLWIGGYISDYLSLAQKINYSTDTASLSTPTPAPMYSNAGFGARQNNMTSNTPVNC